jgi:hypothetical protein
MACQSRAFFKPKREKKLQQAQMLAKKMNSNSKRMADSGEHGQVVLGVHVGHAVHAGQKDACMLKFRHY